MVGTTTRSLGLASIAAATLAIGCPHQSSLGDAATHDAAPEPPDAGPPQPETVTVLVVDDDGPLDGATLIIDDASGVRHGTTTAGGGLATLTDVAWTPGVVSITGVAAHHPIQTLAGFHRSDLGDRADAAGTITLRMRAYYEPVHVVGNILNANPSGTVTLSQSVPGSLTVSGASFSGNVEQLVPFHVFAMDGADTTQTGTLVVFDLAALVDVPHDALTADASFDIDFSSPLPLDTVRGTLPYPPSASPFAHIFPTIYVSTDESDLYARVGRSTSMEVNTSSLGFTVQFASGVAGSLVTLIHTGNAGLRAEVVVDGAPTSTPITLSSDWPVPPRLVAPMPGATAGLHDPITLGTVDPSLPVVVTVSGGSTARWHLELPAGAAALTIPAVPEGTDTSTWTGIEVRIDGCEAWPGHHIHCRRTAGGDRFLATLP